MLGTGAARRGWKEEAELRQFRPKRQREQTLARS